ncbi:NAD-dependent epimerase/dehydratase family protein [Rhodococcus sp. B50]|uniref:NAD-dependent epimerase/dehydratase family protein n=1 Tax=Rhodococcus sp. B50 TaxID=2682847 RepID=UPI001BD2925D|nr:NAD-dependent epimerase/dehydratase family protein [Rhodococcus sp. B50]MBS9375449.1 UDP-glucose 4-epimerase [Rhodococcus sp. B50]
MKAIVTGAAGFIGHTLVKRLLGEGYDVVGVDCFTDYYNTDIKRRNIDAIPDKNNFTLVEADLRTVDLRSLLSDAEVIFHQAGQPGVRKSWGNDFLHYTEMNINATQRLLEAAREVKKLKRLVYASSSSVYGDAEAYPTKETDLPRPVSPYGVSKLAAENLCSLYAKNFGIPVTSLRYFTVYGPGQRPDMAFTRFLRSAIDRSTISIFGDGTQIRDFTYVDDIVNANLMCSQAAEDPGSIYNVAGGSSASVNDVLKVIEEISKSPLNVEYVTSVVGDVKRTGGDIKSISSSVGWEPKVDLRSGLKRHWEWAQSVYRG